jgi:hypothetical protein
MSLDHMARDPGGEAQIDLTYILVSRVDGRYRSSASSRCSGASWKAVLGRQPLLDDVNLGELL